MASGGGAEVLQFNNKMYGTLCTETPNLLYRSELILSYRNSTDLLSPLHQGISEVLQLGSGDTNCMTVQVLPPKEAYRTSLLVQYNGSAGTP